MVISNTKVIRAVLNSLVFLRKDFARTKKAPKVPKAPKSTKKHKKATKQEDKTQINEQK